jgi:hypothetical protein
MALENGFRELLGLKGHKPFECVGEIGECRLIITSLARLEDWRHDILVMKLAPEVSTTGLRLAALEKAALTLNENHILTPEYWDILQDFIHV